MRLEEYRRFGARFAKWRAVLSIADHKPTQLCLKINAHTLARYAAIYQDHELVPIVEPEVYINGSHDLGRCERVMKKTLLTWQGKDTNRELAQKTLLYRARCNGAARSGTYREEMEGE